MNILDDSEFQFCNLIAQFGDFPLEVDAVTLSPDELSLAVATPTGGISIWDLRTWQQISQLEIFNEVFQAPPALRSSTDPIAVRELTFSDDATFVAAALTNDEVPIWIREGTLLEVINRPAVSIAFIPKQNTLALCLYDGRVEFWESLPARLIVAENFFPDASDPFLTAKDLSRCRITASRDGKQLVMLATLWTEGATHVRLQIWALHSHNEHFQVFKQKTLRGPATFFKRVYYWQTQHIICDRSSEYIWGIDSSTDQTIILFQHSSWSSMRSQAIAPDEKHVAIALLNGQVEIWDTDKPKKILHFQAHERAKNDVEAISALFWLKDGKHLLTVGTDHFSRSPGRSANAHSHTTHKKRNTIKIWELSH